MAAQQCPACKRGTLDGDGACPQCGYGVVANCQHVLVPGQAGLTPPRPPKRKRPRPV